MYRTTGHIESDPQGGFLFKVVVLRAGDPKGAFIPTEFTPLPVNDLLILYCDGVAHLRDALLIAQCHME